jgi:LysM repeat protein
MMKRNAISYRAVLAWLALPLGFSLVSGCAKSVYSLDAEEMNQPLMKKALAHEGDGKSDAAILVYQRVLEMDPKMARAHLNLAFLMDEQKKDYIRAIYHYQRYAELRPTTEKRTMINDRIRMAKTAFAATLFQQPPDMRNAIQSLKRENATLKATIVRLQKKAAERESSARVARASPETPTPSPPPAPDIPRTYKVRRGDTLSSIADDVYGDSNKWREIYNANRTRLRSSDGIRIGQILVIPPRD